MLVGSNNHYVSVTDESLFGKIVHGQGDGQLLHTGSYLSELTIDRTNNEAWFDIGRLFVNQGNTAITIKEVGLALNNSTNNYMWTAELMARTALHPDDQMTLNPGEVALIEYRIKYIV